MKTKIALSLLLAIAILPACTTTTTTTSRTTDYKGYADTAAEPAPPAEGPVNPPYIPSPLLRNSAASGL